MLKIGVRLPTTFEDAGEYLADARALDAAGVESLWLDETGLEPWLLLAGIAAVTGRSRLVVPVPAGGGRVAESLRTRVETLARLSRGRVTLSVAGAAEGPQAIEPIVEMARRSPCCVILQTTSDHQARLAARLADGLVALNDSPQAFRASMELVARWREHDRLVQPFELWAAVKMPDDRESWRRTRQDYEAAGATGIILPADPRLLDLLRNGDEDDDRSDLGLAQG
jgi:alkanesulfonate monooxygenase SsuD/methylene tetrahydromethanopterin reductase-like flavin-dependent oxidoreductase (luciferase family)